MGRLNDILLSFHDVRLHCDNFANEQFLLLIAAVGKPRCRICSYGQLVALEASLP